MDDVAGRIKQGQVRRGGRLFLLVIPRHAAEAERRGRAGEGGRARQREGDA